MLMSGSQILVPKRCIPVQGAGCGGAVLASGLTEGKAA